MGKGFNPKKISIELGDEAGQPGLTDEQIEQELAALAGPEEVEDPSKSKLADALRSAGSQFARGAGAESFANTADAVNRGLELATIGAARKKKKKDLLEESKASSFNDLEIDKLV